MEYHETLKQNEIKQEENALIQQRSEVVKEKE
jgi:hypothetical protein